MRMLDLFCGRFGWGKAFAARGWTVVGVDLALPPEVPDGCCFHKLDVMDIGFAWGRFHSAGRDIGEFDFICASPPCEQFSVHGMKHFHPNPPYPELGVKLFEHTRSICEASGLPYVMENVRAAQPFVGTATRHCGPFYLWGNAVPAILPQGITKGFTHDGMRDRVAATRKESIAKIATIPRELADCVASYAGNVIKAPTRNYRLEKALKDVLDHVNSLPAGHYSQWLTWWAEEAKISLRTSSQLPAPSELGKGDFGDVSQHHSGNAGANDHTPTGKAISGER